MCDRRLGKSIKNAPLSSAGVVIRGKIRGYEFASLPRSGAARDHRASGAIVQSLGVLGQGFEMLRALLTLIAFQAAGELVAEFSCLPVPGMIIGLLLLLGAIRLRGRMLGADRAMPPELERVAKSLHDHLGLLFVPAGVGIVADVTSLATDGVGLLAAVFISTVVTIAVTALIASIPRAERISSHAAALE